MLRVDAGGPVVTLTLDRPEVRNAISDEVIEALHKAITTLPDTTRVVILRGEGKAFCAGGDLNWMKKAAGYTEEQNYQDALKLANLFQAMVDAPFVIIARVHGAAFGGGCGIVAAADVAVASPNALFSFSEVRLGLIPATISTFVIPKIGAGNARALFTTGIPFDAEKALRIGLVHDVVSEEELDAKVEEYVASVLKNGPRSVALSKKTAVEGPYENEIAARLLAKVRSEEEGKEGVAAFLEKRPANFVVTR